MESRNSELESKFSELSRSNLDLQRTERELRDRLTTTADRAELEEATRRLRAMEEAECDLKVEVDRLREVADVARNQVGVRVCALSQPISLV